MNAMLAAWYGVPVVLITGDDVAVEQYKEQAPSVRSVVVKRAINTRAGELFPLDEVHAKIAEAARVAVAGAQKRPPQHPASIRVKIRFRDILTPELAEMLPTMERPEPDTIAYTSDSRHGLTIDRFLYRWINPPPPRRGMTIKRRAVGSARPVSWAFETEGCEDSASKERAMCKTYRKLPDSAMDADDWSTAEAYKP